MQFDLYLRRTSLIVSMEFYMDQFITNPCSFTITPSRQSA